MLSLHRLPLPVALWLGDHHGRIDKLGIVVNAIAAYANELKDAVRLSELSSAMEKVVSSVVDITRQDLEVSNPARVPGEC